jgi:tetratricopeptide (TPR) repeat protein
MTTARIITGTVLLALAWAFQAFGQKADGQSTYRVSLPDKDWALDIPLAAFNTVDIKDDPAAGADPAKRSFLATSSPLEILSEDGREYRLMVFRKPDKNATSAYAQLQIRLRPAQTGGGAEDFRAFALKELEKKERLKGGKAETSEYKQIPVARYKTLFEHDAGNFVTGPTPTVNYGPRSMAAYFVKDGVWITLTLSASPFDEAEEKLFYSLLDSAKFVDTSAPSSSFDHYNRGRLFFMGKDYQKAVASLAAALDLEQQKRQLNTEQWRDLVGKLADSYGATVDRARAKEVLEYGISNDPENQTFYMALARLYAVNGDLDNTISTLQKAFSLMKKNSPRVPLPDLKYDSAFKRLMTVDKFREAVKDMRK